MQQLSKEQLAAANEVADNWAAVVGQLPAQTLWSQIEEALGTKNFPTTVAKIIGDRFTPISRDGTVVAYTAN